MDSFYTTNSIQLLSRIAFVFVFLLLELEIRNMSTGTFCATDVTDRTRGDLPIIQRLMEAATVASKQFPVPHDYDYNLSTEINYAYSPEKQTESISSTFVGKYAEHRSQLDYSYHGYYTPERQLFHDIIIDAFHETIIKDGEVTCNVPTENWMVFTAGAMGVGKGFVLRWMNGEGIFPMDAFVRVDPDAIRELLPESKDYFSRDPYQAGYLTQKEVGYISEVMILHALGEGKNVLVDGSLRDANWYRRYIQNIKQLYPRIKIAIIHILASEDTIYRRAAARGALTGRQIPRKRIADSIEQTPRSVAVLSPFTDYVFHIGNEEGWEQPRLVLPIESHVDDDVPISLDPSSYSAAEVHIEDVEDSFLDPDWKEQFKEMWKMTCPPNFKIRSSPVVTPAIDHTSGSDFSSLSAL